MFEKIDKTKRNILFILSIYVLVVAGTVFGGMMSHDSVIKIVMNIVTIVVGVMLFQCYYGHNNGEYVYEICSMPVYLFSIAVSEVLIGIHCVRYVGVIWLVAVAVVAVSEGLRHGVACYLILMLEYLVIVMPSSQDIRLLTCYAVYGVILLLLFSEINYMREFIYVTMILIALSVVLQIIMYEFDGKQIINHIDYAIVQLLGSIVIILAAIIMKLSCIHRKYNDMKAMRFLEIRLNTVLEADYELIRRLHTYSATLFVHSMHISTVAMRAAEYMGCNMLLAKAGGMYHEVGKIRNEDEYVEAGIDLAYAYKFPEELLAIIRQHNPSFEKPRTMEAVIVMFSDCIISTSEYLEKNGKRESVPTDKLVNGIFNNRIEKGCLDESGMSQEQIDKLKIFFVEHAFE